MTDTVNVPREKLEEVRDILAERIQGSPARSPAHNARVLIDTVLAAAPKAEPVIGSIAEVVAELVNETAPDQGGIPSRAFALALSLQAALASKSEAPKVEQEPVGYLEGAAIADLRNGFASVTATVYSKAESGCEAIYTHPAPASDELAEAISGDRAYLSGLRTGWAWGQSDQHEKYERAVNSFVCEISSASMEMKAKHKGPQS